MVPVSPDSRVAPFWSPRPVAVLGGVKDESHLTEGDIGRERSFPRGSLLLLPRGRAAAGTPAPRPLLPDPGPRLAFPRPARSRSLARPPGPEAVASGAGTEPHCRGSPRGPLYLQT